MKAYSIQYVLNLAYMLPHMDYTLERLVAEAERTCTDRGHGIEWHRINAYDGIAEGSCVRCGKTVRCLSRPAPNQIDVGGEAVALNCEGN